MGRTMRIWRISGRKTTLAFTQVGLSSHACLFLDIDRTIDFIGFVLIIFAPGAELNIEFALDDGEGGGIRQGNK